VTARDAPRTPLGAALGADRAVVLHVDDLGATLGANLVFLELAARGLVTCGSAMVPGPWFPHLAEAAARDPALDVGVHLTLTSEWEGYRWAPLTTRSQASGLVDADGYFWRDVESVRRHLVPEAAEAELRAQVERAIAAGIRPTHVDAHMAAAMLPELLDVHVRIGEDYGLWPVLPRSIAWAPDPARYREVVGALDAAGRPVADHCRGTFAVPAAELEPRWEAMIAGLPFGVTHVALHATAPGEFAAVSPQHAPWRFAEYALLRDGAVARLCGAHEVAVIGCRAVQALWQAGDSSGRRDPAHIPRRL
jgi:predicted glycoside hydrolase/deacetylase ChbG (UPF0249 family)